MQGKSDEDLYYPVFCEKKILYLSCILEITQSQAWFWEKNFSDLFSCAKVQKFGTYFRAISRELRFCAKMRENLSAPHFGNFHSSSRPNSKMGLLMKKTVTQLLYLFFFLSYRHILDFRLIPRLIPRHCLEQHTGPQAARQGTSNWHPWFYLQPSNPLWLCRVWDCIRWRWSCEGSLRGGCFWGQFIEEELITELTVFSDTRQVLRGRFGETA